MTSYGNGEDDLLLIILAFADFDCQTMDFLNKGDLTGLCVNGNLYHCWLISNARFAMYLEPTRLHL